MKWLLYFPCFLFGTYINNIASPGILQTGLFSKHNYLINATSGYITDVVWDKRIKPSDQPDYVSLEKVNEFEISSNWATFALIFFRRLEFYTYLGVSKETMDWTNKPQISDTSSVKTKNHFSYVAGVKGLLFYLSRFAFGIDCQYFSIPSSNKLLQRIKNIQLPFDVGNQYLEVEEWQIAGGTSCFLGPFTPYAGVSYREMKVKVRSTTALPTLTFENSSPWGVFAGCSLNFSCNFYLNVEGRFVDELAVGGSATAAF